MIVRRVPLPHGRVLGGVLIYGMLNFGESRKRRRSNALRGRFRRHQLGIIAFQSLQFPHQTIVFGIRQLRIIEYVIPVVVVVDQRTELFEPCLYFHALFDIRRREKSTMR